MKASDAALMKLRLFASSEDKRGWLDTVRRDLAAAFKDDLIERELLDLDRRANPRPSLELPSLTGPALVSATTPLQPTVRRPLRFETTNGTSQLCAANEKGQSPANSFRYSHDSTTDSHVPLPRSARN